MAHEMLCESGEASSTELLNIAIPNDYTILFNAIAAATRLAWGGTAIEVSVTSFRKSVHAARGSAVGAPWQTQAVAAGHFRRNVAQQWREVPREAAHIEGTVILYHAPDWPANRQSAASTDVEYANTPHPCEEAARLVLLDELEDARLEAQRGGMFLDTFAGALGHAIDWIQGEREIEDHSQSSACDDEGQLL
jgi:hypothetical protein